MLLLSEKWQQIRKADPQAPACRGLAVLFLWASMIRTAFSALLNESPSPPQQGSRSKDQDAAEDREEAGAGAAGGGQLVAGIVSDN